MFQGKTTERTVPEWIDPLSGQLEILLLRATGDRTLPSNPFIVRKTIQSVIGPFTDAKPSRDEKSRMQYILMMRNRDHIHQLLKLKSLSDGTPVEIINHPTLNQRRCVVSCRDVIHMTEKELLEELTDQRIIGIKRITRKNPDTREEIPTATLILTVQGTVIPEAIFFGFIRAPTRIYYSNPMQCFRCFQFGHTSKKCRRQADLCRNCGKEHPEEDGKIISCKSQAHCVNCAGKHPSTSRECTVWIKENQINRIRIDQGITYVEAKAKYDIQNNRSSYASQLQERINVNQKIGCNRCKCKCTAATIEDPNSSMDNTTETETDSSSSETEESDATMETIEETKSMKRKIASKQSASEETRTSEDEERRTGTKKKKLPRNEKSANTETRNPNNIATETQQPSTSTASNDQSSKKKNTTSKSNKVKST